MSDSSVPNLVPVWWPMQWSLPAGVHALCTTRLGGHSQEPYASFNLGDHVSDAPQAVAANRALLQTQLGGARPVFLSQVHGVQVATLDAHTPDGTIADACMTQETQLACTIMVADCLPLLFTDDGGTVVAAAHAGWRGLAGGVIEQTVQALCRQAHVQAGQVRVWLGPCIGPQAFEVGAEVCQAFRDNGFETEGLSRAHDQSPDKWWLDLAGLARQRLNRLGVRHIHGNDSTRTWCTVSNPERWFSYRRDRVSGRFAALIWRE